MSTNEKNQAPPSAVEVVKGKSRHLRGTIKQSLDKNITAALNEDDTHLVKFHGIYQQDDRDCRNDRAERKLEPDYSFMMRLRVPGGLLSARQWLTLDGTAAELTESHTLRLTTRQTLQFHGIPKENLRAVSQSCHRTLLDSIAACGDVNRNVMCSLHPSLSRVHKAAHQIAEQISTALLPRSRAYYEIWLGEKKLADSNTGDDTPEAEPLYGDRYLPRKFKIGVAVPPNNDIDVYSQDIGFVAIAENGELAGFNIIVGGGLGMTHSDTRTYPRLGDVIGFCCPQDAATAAWHIAALQRDYGDRTERKQARFKYTVARLGLDFVKSDIERRLGIKLEEARPMTFNNRGDDLGWRQGEDGKWHLGLFILNGRIGGAGTTALQSALREAAALDCCEFLMTPNQNLVLCNMPDKDRPRLQKILHRYEIDVSGEALSGLKKNAMACVALPTCPLAMAEAERYLPRLITLLEGELNERGLKKDDIIIRMTGCPNGCARPYLGEIGLVGKSLGRYNLYLGASFNGDRLSSLHSENLNEEGIINTLKPLFDAYTDKRQSDEKFGDFLVRCGVVKAPDTAADFHPQ